MNDCEPTRRERASLWLRDALPPRGRSKVALRGVGVVLAGIVVLLSALAVATGEPGLLPSLVGFAGVVITLFVVFDIFDG